MAKALMLFGLLYLGMMACSSLMAEYSPLNDRLLFPAFVPLLLAVALLARRVRTF